MTKRDPEVEARRVLADFWVEGLFPVDPIQVANRMGVDVKVGPLPGEVSGALIKRPGRDPVIFLERKDHDNRQRFSCAHELGHYVLRAGGDAYEWVDLRGKAASAGTDAEEVFANKFGAALLMPRSDVKKKWRGSMPLWHLAALFGVSPEAMRWRLKNLGLRCDE